jgi:hypothetical protein
VKELSIKSNLFVPTVARTGEVFQRADRHNRVVLVNWTMIYPALLPDFHPSDIASGNVLELSLAQREARGSRHLWVGQRPFQQAAPTASYIKDMACARYSGRMEMIVDLAQLSCWKVLGIVVVSPHGA